MIAQRYVLGFAFTWDDLITAARDRAQVCGRRQRVTRDEDTWLIVTTPEQVYRPGAHVCAQCPACIHDGHKCCGCYDNACCKEAPHE